MPAEPFILTDQTAAVAGELGKSAAVAFKGGDGQGVAAIVVEGTEFVGIGVVYALDLNANECAFGRGLTAEAPEGADDFDDEEFFGGVGGFPGGEFVVEEDLVIVLVFAVKDEFQGIGTVGESVGGGAAFAFWGFGAGGLHGVEP